MYQPQLPDIFEDQDVSRDQRRRDIEYARHLTAVKAEYERNGVSAEKPEPISRQSRR